MGGSWVYSTQSRPRYCRVNRNEEASLAIRHAPGGVVSYVVLQTQTASPMYTLAASPHSQDQIGGGLLCRFHTVYAVCRMAPLRLYPG